LLFFLGFLDKIFNPTPFFSLALLAEATVDPEHLPEELTFGAPFFSGGPLNLSKQGGRDRQADDFGVSGHLSE